MEEKITELIPESWHIPISIAIIMIVTAIIAAIVARLFNVTIKKAKMNNDAQVISLMFMKRAIVALVYFLGVGLSISLIPPLKALASSMFASAGILAVVVGFASQQALANVVGGIFIVIFKPYRINDRISLKSDLVGIVEDINLRHTVIRNYNNQRIIIPNSVISNEILINSNYNDDLICKWIDIGISYDSDIDLARKIIQEEALKHPDLLDNRSPEEKTAGAEIVPVRLVSMGDSSINLRAYAWARDPMSAFRMSTDLLESVKKRFDREGIEIPFPYRTIVYKNPKQAKGS